MFKKYQNHNQYLLGKILLITICFISSFKSIQAKPTNNSLSIQEITKETCQKQIVILGELPSHGEAQGFSIKAEIVRELIQQCGFNSLFFEAPVYDFIGFQNAINEKQASLIQLDNAIGGFWTTNELKKWREWLFSEATNNNLTIAGLDDQISRSSTYARSILPSLVSKQVNNPLEVKCKQAIERNLFWKYDSEKPYNSNEEMLLHQCSKSAFDNSNINKLNINEIKMLENLTNLYSRTLKNKNSMSRDEIMYQNFKWQINQLPENSKTIIWTATVHAAKKQGLTTNKPLGTWLEESFKDKLSAIGFSAFSGQSSMAGNPIKEIIEAKEGSLEAIVNKSDLDWQFFNSIELNKMGKLSSRLHGKYRSANWSDYYDGVVIVKKESAPTFKTNK